MDDNDSCIEVNFSDLYSLNKSLCKNNILFLYLNVRGLNANFENLELFINNLLVKPNVIKYTETWILPCFTFFTIHDYQCFLITVVSTEQMVLSSILKNLYNQVPR